MSIPLHVLMVVVGLGGLLAIWIYQTNKASKRRPMLITPQTFAPRPQPGRQPPQTHSMPQAAPRRSVSSPAAAPANATYSPSVDETERRFRTVFAMKSDSHREHILAHYMNRHQLPKHLAMQRAMEDLERDRSR